MLFGGKPKPDPAQVAQQLRSSALAMKAAELGLSPSAALPHVWGAVMETWHSETVVSLAVFAEDTTSLYFSTGGGVLGGGKRENVRNASRAFLASAEANLARLSPAASTELPDKGTVRFFIHTFGGLLTAAVSEQGLGLGVDPLTPLFLAAQSVITELRFSTGKDALDKAGLSAGLAPEGQAGQAERQVESVANGIATLRRLATQRTVYREPEPKDTILPAVHDELVAGERDLKAQGMTILGDRMEVQPDGTAVGPGRWFVDEGGTTCGRLSAMLNKAKASITPLVMLFSESESGEYFLTGRGAAGVSLAKPPGLTRQYVIWEDGFGKALELHRASTSRASKSGTLTRVNGIDGALDLFARLRRSGADWRALQDHDILLDLDVRAVLGKRYDELGRRVVAALTRGRR